MEKTLLTEIQELKRVITVLIGVSDLPTENQFSKDALENAAKQFQKLSIERGEWIIDGDISKYIKTAGHSSAKFIIQELKFTNYFKKGHNFYFNKKSLIDLSNALKERNIDLRRYIELIETELSFKKSLIIAVENKKGKKKPFELARDLKDINTTPISMPSPDIVRADIKRLNQEFINLKFADYIDVYKNNFAMLKYIYMFERYLNQGVLRSCKKWCNDFNYAQEALQKITNKKEPFIPIAEDDMIEL